MNPTDPGTRPRRVVAIGGGHGLSRVLAACRRMEVAPTAVVTVADDGGSSGRLRRDLGIIALGDLRMALLALAGDTDLADVLAHRFERGHLEGHALGNLLLVALAERADGDVVGALRAAEELLACEGAVLPATLEPVQIAARVAGRRVSGQAAITNSHGPLESIWLEPHGPAACDDAIAAVQGADAVVLGPGSLFTSVIVNLLVPDLRGAVRDADCPVVHVANVKAPPGETAQLSLRDHVDQLRAALAASDCEAPIFATRIVNGRGEFVPFFATSAVSAPNVVFLNMFPGAFLPERTPLLGGNCG